MRWENAYVPISKIITNLFINGKTYETGKKGDQITFEVPFRIRLSDKLYKILN